MKLCLFILLIMPCLRETSLLVL